MTPEKTENDPLMSVLMVASKSEYAKVAKKFVGINPINGLGSGFALKDKDGYGVRSAEFGNMKESGGPRVNMCTCDCVAGDDGVGCVGTAGVNFRYSNLLWVDPIDGKTWRGQQQGFQLVSDNGTDKELNYMGDDTRLFPGGPVIYNVACTSGACNGFFSGVFRQANHAVSCKTGIEDKKTYDGAMTEEADKQKTCYHRCTNSDTYKEWLQYCEADTEDTAKGFFGYWDKPMSTQV